MLPIITACGSGKFKSTIHGITGGLQDLGHIVLPPPLHNIDGLTAGCPAEARLLAWKGATFAHFERIHRANVCIIVNPTGYLGASSSLELGYACCLGKLIIALQHDEELAREALYDIVLGTSDIHEAVTQIDKLLRNQVSSNGQL